MVLTINFLTIICKQKPPSSSIKSHNVDKKTVAASFIRHTFITIVKQMFYCNQIVRNVVDMVFNSGFEGVEPIFPFGLINNVRNTKSFVIVETRAVFLFVAIDI